MFLLWMWFYKMYHRFFPCVLLEASYFNWVLLGNKMVLLAISWFPCIVRQWQDHSCFLPFEMKWLKKQPAFCAKTSSLASRHILRTTKNINKVQIKCNRNRLQRHVRVLFFSLLTMRVRMYEFLLYFLTRIWWILDL